MNRLPTQLRDVASGLHYLHERDIIHGDLKGVRLTAIDIAMYSQRTCSTTS